MNYDPTSIKSWLIFDEGRKLKQYPDSKGKQTIGIGWCITTRGWPHGVPTDRDLVNVGITDQECDNMFNFVISEEMGCLRCKLSWFDNLSIVRQNALLNMAFNLGCTGFMEFVQCLAFMSKGMWDLAASDLMHTKAAKELPDRYARIHDAILTG